MVGDNEDTDILGAYNYGWDSILVKTGVTKHDSPMATHNCEKLMEGLRKYYPTIEKWDRIWLLYKIIHKFQFLNFQNNYY